MANIFLGVGNLHRADDGVGPFMAKRLAGQDGLKKAGVTVMEHSGEGASLMHIWQGADKVVVVDAMRSGGNPGSVHRFDAITDILSYGVFRYSSHLFGLAEATEMSRKLKMLPKELIIYGIEGEQFDFGADMSPEVAAAVEEVEAAVIAEFVVKCYRKNGHRTKSG